MAALPVLVLAAACLAFSSYLSASAAPTTLDPIGAGLFAAKANLSQVQEAAGPTSTSVQEEAATTEQAKDEKRKEEIDKLKQEAKGLVSFTNGTGSYKGMSGEFIAGHNKVRERYGVPAMKWNKKLARHARRWANAMRKDCQLKHSPSEYGESVFASHKTNGWNATAMDALSSWISEEPLYDKLTGTCTAGRHFSECGHFSLMVEERNQKLGCGRAECYSGGVFITCNYYIRDRDP